MIVHTTSDGPVPQGQDPLPALGQGWLQWPHRTPDVEPEPLEHGSVPSAQHRGV
jgi:hypothetical protein